jgi:Fe2+ or Zn2+ uptake regulation protein
MPLNNMSIFKSTLTDNGYRITKAREDTFKLLIGSEPQTIKELITKSKGQIDRVSIYRNIDLFEQLGIVQRSYIGWRYKLELSDHFISHHHHLNCLRCGQTIDIRDEKHIDNFIQNVCQDFDFQLRNHQFEIDGYCSNCKDI